MEKRLDFSLLFYRNLKDFMYECNKGKDIYFQRMASLAVDRLSESTENKMRK